MYHTNSVNTGIITNHGKVSNAMCLRALIGVITFGLLLEHHLVTENFTSCLTFRSCSVFAASRSGCCGTPYNL